MAAKEESNQETVVATAEWKALSPTLQASITIKQYSASHEGTDLQDLFNSLANHTRAAKNGDLCRAKVMLAAQAHTLDAIFNELARRACHAEWMDNMEKYLKLALRAQSQCRATLEALSVIQNPPVVGYVKQANIAHGPQQVNNTPITPCDAPRARENENLENKLLEEKDGERMDSGATGSAGWVDTEVAPMGKINWS